MPACQADAGTIWVTPQVAADGRTVVYARVSSSEQEESLPLRVARVVEWATEDGVSVDEVVGEVGAALSGARRRFLELLGDPEVAVIVCEHRDRVCRFGFEYVAAAMGAHGRSIVVVDDAEVADDQVRDTTEVLTSLCARVYGRRGAAKRAAAAAAARSAVPAEAGIGDG